MKLATAVGVPLPVPARSKVYRGFNFTFPQPIRMQLWLLGNFDPLREFDCKDLKLPQQLCLVFPHLLIKTFFSTISKADSLISSHVYVKVLNYK